MPTIAIIGAGPGLGLSIARVFGNHGFDVALIARTQTTLDALAAQLGQDGITAEGFAADILDRDALRRALHAATVRFGQIDVLEFSPAPHAPVPGLEMASATEVTVENIQPQLEFYLHAAITAVGEVLPAMTDRGAGTLLFTTGAGSVTPIPQMGNVNAAAAALRNWAINLHTTLQPVGIYAAHVAIGVYINSGPEETSADRIAQLYWDAYTTRDGAEHIYAPKVTTP
ncbi:MAG: SDR family NAD(P)-dependent oxidoreductase [Propionibacteriaceae bacterium]|nr:SDR family NAD(P)-dependent oxidoreductase [Actinomycetota bacterium]MCW5953110.1 SDR family NAD(P)-dependent oxidoreductase [Propionibacteriaceae bacterium]